VKEARPATRRLFFALWPSVFAQQALAAVAAPYVRGKAARAMHAHNLHVTLAFLGSVPESRLAELESLAAALARSRATDGPLTLRFDRLEYWARVGILVAVGPGRDGASRLAEDLKQALARAGFSPDLKPFRQHVTLARKVSPCEDVVLTSPVQWSCDAFSLIESRTAADGASYSIVKSWTLFASGAPENRA
jgi:2'-5' RNA ligase